MKKIIIAIILVCMFAFMLVGCNSTKYQQAQDLIEAGDYLAAYQLLEELGDYKDAQEMLSNFRYVPIKGAATSSDRSVEILYNKENLPMQYIIKHNGTPQSMREFAYDSNGNLIKETSIGYYSDNSTEISITEYAYDASRNLIQEIHTAPHGIKSITDYTYNRSGLLIKKAVTDGSGEKTTYDYNYDANNNLIKTVSKKSDGYQATTSYTYDGKGNLIKKVNSNNTFDYTYDTNGNLIKTVLTWHDDGGKFYNEYTYDTNGNLIQNISHNSYNSERTTYNYTFDGNGNIISTSVSYPDKSSKHATVGYELVYIATGVTENIEKIINPDSCFSVFL